MAQASCRLQACACLIEHDWVQHLHIDIAVGLSVVSTRSETTRGVRRGLEHGLPCKAYAADTALRAPVAAHLTPHAAGGVLVCAENFIFYKKEGFERNIQAVIPRRNTLNEDRGVLITAWSVHKPKAGFFFLLQASVSAGHDCCYDSPVR